MRIKAHVTFETVVNINEQNLEPDETPSEYLNALFDEGLKQYMKDYDPDLGFEVPVSIAIVKIENE